MTKRNVLILCTGNSCRSQMAEGLINHFQAECWQAFSAGTEPSGYVHPLAVQAMTELGIDIAANRSKSTEEVRDVKFDVVITVCDDAAEKCPLWLNGGEVVHIGFYDPAKAKGSEPEQLQVFRHVRDQIRSEVLSFLNDF